MLSVASSPLRGTLAANIRKLIEHDLRAGERYSVRAWALGRALDVKLIDRLTKGEHAVTLDTLYTIAQACNVQPWHLLLDDFDPAHPADAPISEADRQMLSKLRRLLAD